MPPMPRPWPPSGAVTGACGRRHALRGPSSRRGPSPQGSRWPQVEWADDRLSPHRPSDRHLHREARPGRDAPRRRDHGRGRRRAGQGGRGRRCGGRHGPRAGARRHPARRRGGPDERPGPDRGDQGGRHRPGHGQGPDRPLRRGPGAGRPRGRLHRRERGPHPGRRGPPHRQVGLRGALRVRCHQPGRGPAAHLGGGGHDPLQGRGRHRQHRRGRPPPALHPRATSAR